MPRCTLSLAEERDLCGGRIGPPPPRGLQDANSSQKGRITGNQLQSITLPRQRAARASSGKKRNKKRLLTRGGFGGFVVFGEGKKMEKKNKTEKGLHSKAQRAGTGGTAGSCRCCAPWGVRARPCCCPSGPPKCVESTWEWVGIVDRGLCPAQGGWLLPSQTRAATAKPSWGNPTQRAAKLGAKRVLFCSPNILQAVELKRCLGMLGTPQPPSERCFGSPFSSWPHQNLWHCQQGGARASLRPRKTGDDPLGGRCASSPRHLLV